MKDKKNKSVGITSPEPSFDDLQADFDEQRRRLTAIFDRPGVNPPGFDFSAVRRFSNVGLMECLFKSVLFVAATILWGINLGRYDYDLSFRILIVAIELIFLALSVLCIYKAVLLLRRRASCRMGSIRHPGFGDATVLAKSYVPVGIAAAINIVMVVNSGLYGLKPDAEATELLVSIINGI